MKRQIETKYYAFDYSRAMQKRYGAWQNLTIHCMVAKTGGEYEIDCLWNEKYIPWPLMELLNLELTQDIKEAAKMQWVAIQDEEEEIGLDMGIID